MTCDNHFDKQCIFAIIIGQHIVVCCYFTILQWMSVNDAEIRRAFRFFSNNEKENHEKWETRREIRKKEKLSQVW